MPDYPIGRTITNVRRLTQDELEYEYWQGGESCLVLELDDGSVLYPSRDPEGNGPGCIFGIDHDMSHMRLIPNFTEREQ